MKKNIYVLSLLSLLVLTGCGGSQEEKSRITGESTSVASTSTDDTKTAEKLDGDELKTFPSIFISKLNEYKTYKAVSKGQTESVVIGMTVVQSIDVVVIKSDYSYLLNESHSSMVNTEHTAYFHSLEAVYKDKDKEFAVSSIDEYLSVYGTYPFDNAIEGYIINNDSVVSVTKEKVENNYCFTLTLDKEKATNNVKIQMKKFGGLDDYPVFKEDVVLKITVQNDFSPVSLSLSSSYTAKLFLESDCKQNYSVTYSNFNEELEVPGLNEVKDKFTK